MKFNFILKRYIFKGHDRATVEFAVDPVEGQVPQPAAEPPRPQGQSNEANQPHQQHQDRQRQQQQHNGRRARNEIRQYLDCRYVCAHEALWRIFKFKLHGESPSVVRLNYHLPNQQRVSFQPNARNMQEVLEANRRTMLTEWFRYNQENEEARQYTFAEAPCHYVWNKQQKRWRPRLRRNVIGRMYFASPRDEERFCLRLLLHHVRGATSFESLRTINGTQFNTFKV